MPKYDPPTGRYTSRIPPGTVGFRAYVADRFSFSRTEVIRDASRCRQKSSEHCECRAIDFFTTSVPKGRKVFEWAIANADTYGIQSIIFNRRVWGFGKWYERAYTGPSPHTDHVHIGLNVKGSQSFTGTIEQEVYDVFYMKDKKLYQVVTIPGKGGRSVWVGKGKFGSSRKKALEKVGVKILTGTLADDLAKAFPEEKV